MASERRMTPEEMVVYCAEHLIQVVVVSRKSCPISAFKPLSVPSSSTSSSSSSFPSSSSTTAADTAAPHLYVYDSTIPNKKEFLTLYARDYISRTWKYDLYSPFSLSIYLRESDEDNSLILIERWTFQCVRGSSNNNYANNDSGRSSLSRRISILIRSLYCYVRMLPAFHIGARGSTSLIFKIGAASALSTITGTGLTGGEKLRNEFTFPKLPSSVVGFMTIRVTYMDPDDIKDAPRVNLEEVNKHTHAAIPSRLTMPMPIPSSSSDSSKKQVPPSMLATTALITTTSNTPGGNLRHRSVSIGNDPGSNPNQSRHKEDTSISHHANANDAIDHQRSRSSDSAPLYLQEVIGGVSNPMCTSSSSTSNQQQQQQQQFTPSSASPPFPVNFTPPFANDYLFSQTPDGGGYNISLSSSLIARQQKDNSSRSSDRSPIIPNLLSTSPQIGSIPPIDLSFVRGRMSVGQQQHAENVMNDAYPHMLRLSELPASPFDGTSHNININMKRITNGIIGDSDSEVIATGGKARRSSKTSTRSGSMSNDENLCEDDVDDDDLHNSNDDIDEGIFALDEDMPFVCDDDDYYDDSDDKKHHVNSDINSEGQFGDADSSNLGDDNDKIASKVNSGVSTFVCSDKILNPPVLHLFSRDRQLDGASDSVPFSENDQIESADAGVKMDDDHQERGGRQQQQQRRRFMDSNDNRDREGARTLIEEFKKFHVAFDDEL